MSGGGWPPLSVSCCGLLADDDGAVDALDHAVHAGVDTGTETLFGNFTNDVAALDAIAGLHHGLGRGADVLPQRDAHFSRGECAQIVGGQLHVAADADLVDQAGHGHPAEFTPLGVGFVHVAAAFVLHPGRAQLILDGLVDAAGGQAHGTGHVFAHAAVAAEEREPAGFGGQPLYQLSVSLCAKGKELDVWSRRIGLRTMTVSRRKDQWGESFSHCVNGVDIFAMGADYIPEDNLLPRVNPERTRRLLEDAKAANMNCIRVWGGGYYPDDFFYDICDELGLLVWQDFMFACAVYNLTDAFEENITAEFVDNVRRLRHHASLALWCGNNEMEQFVAQGEWVTSMRQKADYIKMYEYIIPKVLKAEDPQAFYWPASPSSGGSFDDPQDPTRGDVHYWMVWHGLLPFTDYRNHQFRYVSEFGFQSFPCMETIESFTAPEDRNVFSYVMEKHQRNASANGRILFYLSQMYLYPRSLELLVYASQLLQAQAMQYGVEHWRRHRGCCMGAVVWQLNDCWPVASWASIDYFGRWKALHYYEKRFFAPVLISCHEEGILSQNTNVNAEPFGLKKSAHLNVSNETMQEFRGKAKWSLRRPDASVIEEGSFDVTVPALSAVWLPEQDFSNYGTYDTYYSYQLLDEAGNGVGDGSVLFCAPKHFRFADPELNAFVKDDNIIVTAKGYARSVEIQAGADVVLSDNYFDMDGGVKAVKILRGSVDSVSVRSVWDIR